MLLPVQQEHNSLSQYLLLILILHSSFYIIMTGCLNVHCLGESHKDSGKPCQDYSYSHVDDNMAIAVVCDGHGGERYFRSDVGAKAATEIIVEVVRLFVKQTDPKLFKSTPYTAEGVVTESEKKLTPLDVKFRQMFSSIITKWNERIELHAKENPLSEWELEHVPEKYRLEFLDNLTRPFADSTLNKQYGCTLMVYVQTEDYWFAFHLGDGKCISFHNDINFHGQQQVWDEPIPWDERCFLNKTTSICDSEAINEFRYCYGNSSATPVAVFLGSDGIDDTYGEMQNIAYFYVEILKILVKDGIAAATQQLRDDLPIISRIGSKDDASVAAVFNMVTANTYIGKFIQFQIDYMGLQAEEQADRIKMLDRKQQQLKEQMSKWNTDMKKAGIEFNYAIKDLRKASDRLEILSGKIAFLAKEQQTFTGNEFEQQIDYSEIIEQAKETLKSQETELDKDSLTQDSTEPTGAATDGEPVTNPDDETMTETKEAATEETVTEETATEEAATEEAATEEKLPLENGEMDEVLSDCTEETTETPDEQTADPSNGVPV